MKIDLKVTAIERNSWAPDRCTVTLEEVTHDIESGAHEAMKNGRTMRLSMWNTQAVDFQYGDTYQITIEEASA